MLTHKCFNVQVETERAQLKRADVADAARALDETRTLVTLKEREKHEATEAANAISHKISELQTEVNTLARQGAERYAAADKANAGTSSNPHAIVDCQVQASWQAHPVIICCVDLDRCSPECNRYGKLADMLLVSR